MGEVAKVLTPLDELGIAKALERAYVTLFGHPPPIQVMGVAWAQIALENAHGKAIWCHNFGNITGVAKESGDYYTLATSEQTMPGVWERKTMKYAAHGTAEDGAAAYWRLVTGSHYAGAYGFFVKGDASGAANELHSLGYFTANPGPIAISFGRLYEHFQGKLAAELEPIDDDDDLANA